MHSILSDSISGFGEGHGGTAAGQKGNKRYEAEWQRPTSELPSSPLTPHFCWLSSKKGSISDPGQVELIGYP